MDLIDTKETATILGKSERTVRRWVSSGRLPVAEWRCGKRGGRSGRVPVFDRETVESGHALILQNGHALTEKGGMIGDNSDKSVRNVSAIKNEDVRNVSAIDKPRSSNNITRGVWLSFSEVLFLSILEKRGTVADISEDKGEMSSNFSEKIDLEDIFDTAFDSQNSEIEDISTDKDIADSNDNYDKLEDIKCSAEFKRLTRHIKEGKVVSRRDPKDSRKVLILLSSLSESLRFLYREYYIKKEMKEKLLDPTLSEGKGSNSRLKEVVVSMVFEARHSKFVKSELIERICQKYSLNSSTIYRWYNKAYDSSLDKLDLGKLLKKPNKNRGVKKVTFSKDITDYFAEWVVRYGKFNVQRARRAVVDRFGVTISNRKAYEIVENNPALWLVHMELYHADKARWLHRVYTKQTREGLKPLEVVTTDGHICDVLVKSLAGDFRPVVVEIYDVATGMPLGWSIGRVENRESCNRALVDAIIKFGHFETLHQDQGKSFWQSDALRLQIKQYLNINIHAVPGFSPHKKGHQERNFGAGIEDYIGKVLAGKGYVGNSVANRQREKVSKPVKAKLTYHEFCNIVEDYYNTAAIHRPQGGLNGKSAAEAWQEWERKGFTCKRYYDDEKTLIKALVIALGERRQILTKGGYVGFTRNKKEYLYISPELIKISGKKVTICCSYDNPSIAYVFWQDKFFCEVTHVDRVRVNERPEWVIDFKEKSEQVRKKMIGSVKAKFDKFDLNQEQAKYSFRNVSGFEPIAEIGDISMTRMDELITSLNNHSTTGKAVTTKPLKPKEEIGIFDEYYSSGTNEIEDIDMYE